MLQNVWVIDFTASELLRENQEGGLKVPPVPHTQIRVNRFELNLHLKMCYSRPIFGYSLQKHQQQHGNQSTNLQCKTGNRVKM